jgi:hypothetical protein
MGFYRKVKQKAFSVLLGTFFACCLLNPSQAKELPAIFKTSFSIGAQFYDYQNYQQIPYLHGGMDLCAPAGTEIFTPVSGTLSVNAYRIEAGNDPARFVYHRKNFHQGEVSDTRYLEVSIVDQDGNNWMFRHVDPMSVSDEIFMHAREKKAIEAGTCIGRIARWILPVKPEPSLYHHIHLEIVASSGHYLNPADFVATSRDYYPPSIAGIYLVSFDRDQAFSQYPHPIVKGKISIIAGLTDRMNKAAFLHSVYSAEVDLQSFSASENQWRIVKNYQAYRFDRLPIIGDRTQLAKVIYRDSIVVGQKRIFANGNDGPRFFLLNLTAGDIKRGYDSYNGLETRDLPNGFYRLQLKVSDRAGNEKTAFQDFIIKN